MIATAEVPTVLVSIPVAKPPQVIGEIVHAIFLLVQTEIVAL